MAINLLDMILSTQGGAAAQEAGKTLGLDASQTQSAVAALLPAISSALKKNTQNPEGLAALLGALQKGNHGQYIEQPKLMDRPETVTDGNAILGHLFGSKDVSRAVAGQAAQTTGISPSILKRLLPMVATMAMGSLSKQTAAPSMQSQLAKIAMDKLLGGGQSSAAGLGNILGAVLGGGQTAQPQQAQQAHQQGLGLLGKMFDADGDGNVMDDVLNMAMQQMTKR